MKTNKLPKKIKRLIDSSWKMGRYIMSTDKVEELRVLILEELDRVEIKVKKKVGE